MGASDCGTVVPVIGKETKITLVPSAKISTTFRVSHYLYLFISSSHNRTSISQFKKYKARKQKVVMHFSLCGILHN